MNHIKIETCPFVNHVRIKTFRTKQADLSNKLPPLLNERCQLAFKILDLMFDPRPANEAEFAIERMKAEIGQCRHGDDGNDQSADEGLFALTGRSGHDVDLGT